MGTRQWSNPPRTGKRPAANSVIECACCGLGIGLTNLAIPAEIIWCALPGYRVHIAVTRGLPRYSATECAGCELGIGLTSHSVPTAVA